MAKYTIMSLSAERLNLEDTISLLHEVYYFVVLMIGSFETMKLISKYVSYTGDIFVKDIS